MTTKILPCPECGSTNLSVLKYLSETEYFTIKCNECDYETWRYRFPMTLLEHWNTHRRRKK
ncbi:MAG: hypothetical protein IJT21_07675 [Synergistaceae bacterium]|nr:hypothetical protein [Synergistaceae bacterium]